MSEPYVSLIVTAYDRKQFIYDAIMSVVNQNFERSAYEIIVVANFDLDSQFVNKYGIKVVHCNEKGIGIKVVAALKHANGEVISILEDDDLWEPDKLPTITRLFRSMPDVGFVHNWMNMIDDVGNLFETSFQKKTSRVLDNLDKIVCHKLDANKASYDEIRLSISYATDFYPSSISIRRQILTAHQAGLSAISRSTDAFYFYACLVEGLKTTGS